MSASILHTKAARVTTTGLISALLAVCTVNVAPGSAAALTTAKSPALTPTPVSSFEPLTLDGFHW